MIEDNSSDLSVPPNPGPGLRAADYGWMPGVLDMAAAQAAVDAALATGRTLILDDGTYLVDVRPETGMMLQVLGDGTGSLTIAGSGATRLEVVTPNAQPELIRVTNIDYFEISNLEIDGNKDHITPGPGATVSSVGVRETHFEYLNVHDAGPLRAISSVLRHADTLVFGNLEFDLIQGAAAVMIKKNGLAHVVQNGPVTVENGSGGFTFDSDPDFSVSLGPVLSITNDPGSTSLLLTLANPRPYQEFQPGDWFEISGADQAAYNGWFQIDEITASTIRFTAPVAPDTQAATGALTTSVIPDLLGIANEAGSHEFTLTFAVPHGRQVGDWIEVHGAKQVAYNGRFQVVDFTETTVTVSQALTIETTHATGKIAATWSWGPVETVDLTSLHAAHMYSDLHEGDTELSGQVRSIKLEDGIRHVVIGEVVAVDHHATTPANPDRSSALLVGAGAADLPVHSLDAELISGTQVGDVVRMNVGRDDFGRIDIETLYASETRSAVVISPVFNYGAYAEGHGEIDTLRIGHLILDTGAEAGIRIDDSRVSVFGAIMHTLIIGRVTNPDGAPVLVLTPGAIERIVGGAHGDAFAGSSGAETIEGRGGRDVLFGADGDDVLLGGSGKDTLQGEGGDDALSGSAGDDILFGGAGHDLLTGGDGADLFRFDDGDSSADRALADRVEDFSRADGDRINLKPVDSDATAAGDQKFRFVGEAAFTGRARELHFVHDGGNTFVEGDIDGDGHADFAIGLAGLVDLTAADFVL